MAPPRAPKIIAGTMAATIALTAGAAIAGDGGQEPEEPKLDDVVLVRDVAQTDFSTTTVTMLDADESVASPFDTVMSVDSTDSMDSTESVDSTDSTDSVDSTESVDSTDSTDSVDSTESVDSTDSADSTESVDSTDSADTP